MAKKKATAPKKDSQTPAAEEFLKAKGDKPKVAAPAKAKAPKKAK